jgi:hypothetical protein
MAASGGRGPRSRSRAHDAIRGRRERPEDRTYRPAFGVGLEYPLHDRVEDIFQGGEMMNISRILAMAVLFLFFAFPATAKMTTCNMTYSLKGWSFFYKAYEGSGTVTCRNGQSANIGIVTKGGGLTIGKSEIEGAGTFSAVKDISEIFGTYVAVDAHAGATRSGEGWAMTKGEISLALSGKGRGFDLGFALGSFTITRK